MRINLWCFLMFIVYPVFAQSVRINEIVSSNSEYYDEDGDSPDWIELHNYGAQDVTLTKWSLTDDANQWIMPNITLKADEYMLIWASSKNRTQVSYARTLVNQGDDFKYMLPTSEPSVDWKQLNFDDTNWSSGSSGFGYSDGDDATFIPTGTTSVYLRKKFTIGSLDNITSLILDIDYDDGFVAYINGVEVARANINGNPPSYTTTTIQDHEALMYNGGKPDRFVISNFATLLNVGDNILTIQGHNVSDNSSDFTLIPFLSVIYSLPVNVGVVPPDVLDLKTNNLHTNFSISSNIETISLLDSMGVLKDQITVESLPPNASLGISPVSGNQVCYLNTTPGYRNSSQEYMGYVRSKVNFSKQEGVVDASFNLTLSGNQPNEIIRYELGGKEPTNTSPKYQNAIPINTNTSVRARIFAEDYLPSPIYSSSYILGADHQVDVMLMTVNPTDFFDADTGIYVFGPEGTYNQNIPYFGANFWEDWERPIHFSFHDHELDSTVAFNAGVKIFGGWSRGQNGQRSLSLFARGKYGDVEFKHPFFNQLEYDNFEALVLRNSGQDWMRTSIKDITLTSLMRGAGIDFSEHNPVATYLNGSYWGMYNLREKINEHMLASKHNIDPQDITILTNNAEAVEGDNTEYTQLINYVSTTDLSVNSNFNYVAERVDVKSYAVYQAANIYFNNTDWPGNNIKFWKHPAGKWRWIMYDTDFGFGPWWNISNYDENTLSFALEPNGPGWPNPSWSTLLFRRMIKNIGFRNQFINRYADELNTRFLPVNVIAHINNVYQTVKPEIDAHYNRWKSDPSINYTNINDINGWINYYLDEMENFAINRHLLVKDHILNEFNLPDYHTLTITNNDVKAGFVHVNDNLDIAKPSWSGDYFETVPVKLKAISQLGYEFSHWSGDLYSTDITIEVSIEDALEVIPVFKTAETLVYPIVINEINYRSSDEMNTDDWIELYNPNSSAIDLSNWQLKDDDDLNVFDIPSGTVIESESYLIIVKDSANFSNFHPDIANFIGEFGFGFGKTDSVRLYNENNLLHDKVGYQSEYPWPDCADETGYTLELFSPDLDNELPESWGCLNKQGSPNAFNKKRLPIDERLYIYPNPVRNTLFIGGVLNAFNVKVYSSVGQLVMAVSNQTQLDVHQLSNGIYYLLLEEDGETVNRSFVKY